jgi:hypothetical protein
MKRSFVRVDLHPMNSSTTTSRRFFMLKLARHPAASIGLVLLCVAGCGKPPTAPKPTVILIPPGEVFQQYGTFGFPGRPFTVTVAPEGPQQATITVRRGPGSWGTTKFKPDEPWFCAWSSTGELWTYFAETGALAHYSLSEGHGTRKPGHLGGWQDVPEAFLARLPAAELETYREAQRVAEQ